MLQQLLRRLVFDVPLLTEYCKMPLRVGNSLLHFSPPHFNSPCCFADCATLSCKSLLLLLCIFNYAARLVYLFSL